MSPATRNRNGLLSLAGSFVGIVVLSAGAPVANGGVMVPDFALMDVNSTSSTYGQLVSPRDYLQQVSGWYFGHASS